MEDEKNQQPPYSLQYFMSRKVSQEKAKTGRDATDIKAVIKQDEVTMNTNPKGTIRFCTPPGMTMGGVT